MEAFLLRFAAILFVEPAVMKLSWRRTPSWSGLLSIRENSYVLCFKMFKIDLVKILDVIDESSIAITQARHLIHHTCRNHIETHVRIIWSTPTCSWYDPLALCVSTSYHHAGILVPWFWYMTIWYNALIQITVRGSWHEFDDTYRGNS